MKTILLILALAGSVYAEVGVSLYTNGISQGAADARYLKLDASNDPVTGNLDLRGQLAISSGTSLIPAIVFSTGPYPTYPIGIMAPGNRIHLGWGDSNGRQLQLNTADITFRNVLYPSFNGSATAPIYTTANNDSNTGMYGVSTDNIGFSVAGSHVVSISSMGVGIGTTMSDAKLDIRYAPAIDTTAEAIRLGRTDNSLRNHSIFGQHSTTGANNFIQFRLHPGGGSGTEAQITPLTLLGSGNVGIGTTAPATKLEVSGSTNGVYNSGVTMYGGAISRVTNADTTLDGYSAIEFNKATTNASATGNIYLRAVTNALGGAVMGFGVRGSDGLVTEKMAILADGNVGIATTSPTSQLTIGAGGKTWIDGYAEGLYAFNYSGNTLSSGTVLENAHDSGYLAEGVIAFSTHTAGEVYPIGTLYDASCAPLALCRVCDRGLCPAKLESGSDCDIANVAVLASGAGGEDGRAVCAVSPGTAVHNGEIGQVQEFTLVNGDTINIWAHRN